MNLLKDKNVSLAFLVVSVVLALLVVPNLSMNVLKHLDSAVVRIVVMVCIVGLSLVDPVKALLLSIILVVSLQTLSDLKRAKPKVNVVTLVNDLVNTLKNNVMNNDKELEETSNDEASDEASDEGSDNAFDETSDTDLVNNVTMENTGLEANDLLSPEESELLNNSLAFNNLPENSVSQPVLLGDVPTNDTRTVKNFNAKPYNNGISKAKANLAPELKDTADKIVIGSLLNEGFENPGDSKNMNSEEVGENTELNNVLTYQVEEKKVPVFTSNNQLLDIQSNEVNCVGNDMRVTSSKEQLGPQGMVRPFGYSS